MEAIKRGLEKNGIYYSIDVQDIKYRDDIVAYEKEIGSADKVIMFITATYLKSIDCMFEMTEIFKKAASIFSSFFHGYFLLIEHKLK